MDNYETKETGVNTINKEKVKKEKITPRQELNRFGLKPILTELKKIFTRSRGERGKRHLRIITNTLKEGVYSEKAFLKLLMRFVVNEKQQLSIITYEVPQKENIVNLFEIVELFLKDKDYRNQVSLYVVKKDKKVLFENNLREQFFPYLEDHSLDSSPLSLFLSQDHAFRLSFVDKEWDITSYFDHKSDKIGLGNSWFNQLIQSENEIEPYPLKVKTKEKQTSSNWSFANVITHLSALILK